MINRYRMTGLQPAGLPHSEIPGSKLAYSFPGLIAVRHVLLRHLVRRHPPYALCAFTICNILMCYTLSLTADPLYITVKIWWAWADLNSRPHAYQACALTKLSYKPTLSFKNYLKAIEICANQQGLCTL